MKAALVLTFTVLCGALCATALWDEDLVVRGSAGVETCTTGCPVSDGGMLYVWSDAHARDRDIYAMRVNSAGQMLWPFPRVVDGKAMVQKKPVVVGTSDGCFVVAWLDLSVHREGDIRVQKIDAECNTLWQEGGISVTNDAVYDFDIRMVADGLGGVIITWNQEPDSYIYARGQSYAGDGTRRWQEGGLDLTGLQLYTISDVKADGADGIIYTYSSEYTSDSRVYINRRNSAGTPVWNEPVCLGDSTDMARGGRFAMDGGSVYVSWSCWDGSVTLNNLSRFSTQGSPLWAGPVDISSGQDVYCGIQDIEYSASDNSVIISTIRTIGTSELAVYKFSSTGQSAWPAGILIQDYGQYYYMSSSSGIAPDGAGGFYITWVDPSPQYYIAGIRVQRYSASGEPQWQAGGLSVSQIGNMESYPRSALSGGNLWLAWGGKDMANRGIWYQRVTPQGTLLAGENGRMLCAGLESMYTESYITLSRGEDMLVVWEDDRAPLQLSRIYVQAVDINGAVDYTQNGIPVTDSTNFSQSLLTAKVIPGGSTLIVWQQAGTYPSEMRAQLLGVNGELLWGDDGLVLGVAPEGWIYRTQVWWLDGALFVAWTRAIYAAGVMVNSVYMQKIVGGVIQWGESGLNVTGGNGVYSDALAGMDGGYLVYTRSLPSQGSPADLYIMAFDPASGATLPGWGTWGIPVAESGGGTLYYRYLDNMRVFPDRVFLLYDEMSSLPDDGIKVQMLSAAGEYLLPPSGTQLLGPDYPASYVSSHCSEQDFLLMCDHYQDDLYQRMVYRFGYDLVPLWDAVQLPEYQEYSTGLGLARFANGACVTGWVDNLWGPDQFGTAVLKYVYITPEGGLLGNDPVQELDTACYAAYRPVVTAAGNHALVTWLDGSSSYAWKDEPIEHSRLWAQMIGNATTAIPSDEISPAVVARLDQNYPNPFNPSTSIRFELKAPTHMVLNVYNLKGQLVRCLVDGWSPKGEASVQWDGRDGYGAMVASGVYLYRLEAGGTRVTRKMLLMK